MEFHFRFRLQTVLTEFRRPCNPLLGKESSGDRLAGFFEGANQALHEVGLRFFVDVKGAGVSSVR